MREHQKYAWNLYCMHTYAITFVPLALRTREIYLAAIKKSWLFVYAHWIPRSLLTDDFLEELFEIDSKYFSNWCNFNNITIPLHLRLAA